MSTLHGADGVKKNQVSRHHQKKKHTSRAGIHICKETKMEFRLKIRLEHTGTLQPSWAPGDKAAQLWSNQK